MSRTFNLADVFEVVVETVPERLAYVSDSKQLTFAQLNERINKLGNALKAKGFKRGDNVGIQLVNSSEYLEAFFACVKFGAVPININYRYTAKELEYLYNNLDLKGIFYNDIHEAEVTKAADASSKMEMRVCVGTAQDAKATAYEELLATGDAELTDPDRSDNDIYILCTGGTTGMPKGVVWPHKSLFMAALGGGGIFFRQPPIAAPEALKQMIPHAPPLRFLAVAPLMHGAAMWSSMISLFSGHTVVVNDDQKFNAEQLLDLVGRLHVNIVSVVGDTMALPVVQALEANPDRWDLSAVASFGSGGAVLSESIQKRVQRFIPNGIVHNGVGSSETGIVGSGGKPTDGGDGFMVLDPRPDIAILDENHNFLRTPGDEGIMSRTGYTPIGYYNAPEKTAETFVKLGDHVWVISGDRARITEDGKYVVLGRDSQCINTGGEKVFAEEVEEAARGVDFVQDVVVVGKPDERWGNKVCAIVQLRDGMAFDNEKFQAVCREQLSGFKMPKEIFVVPEVKRSPAGKPDYTWAKEQAANATSVI